MPRNGSGVYSPPGANYPAVAGTTITAADRNAVDADIATAITSSIATDGQSVISADIPMSNNKITGLKTGTAATDATNLGQVQSGASTVLNSVSGADTITATLSPPLTAYASGQMFKLIPASNNTGAVTLNINSLGAKAVTKNGTTALAADDLVAGVVYIVEYDGTRFQAIGAGLQTIQSVVVTNTSNIATNTSDIASLETDKLEVSAKASTAEAEAGSDDAKYMTALKTKEAIDGQVFNNNSLPAFLCRAWGYFNGVGTVAIIAGGNFASITDGGVGTYGVTFTTAMPDANYAVTVGIEDTGSAVGAQITGKTASGFTINTYQWNGSSSGGKLDQDNVSFTVFR